MRTNKISARRFRPYGRVIDYSNKEKKSRHRNLFRIVLTEPAKTGWRIAYLIVRDKTIRSLECHPHSFESFEPVLGKSLLYVSVTQDADRIECFELDRPVILKKGIWHGIVTVGPEAEVKLTENARVKCVYWRLKDKLTG